MWLAPSGDAARNMLPRVRLLMLSECVESQEGLEASVAYAGSVANVYLLQLYAFVWASRLAGVN